MSDDLALPAPVGRGVRPDSERGIAFDQAVTQWCEALLDLKRDRAPLRSRRAGNAMPNPSEFFSKHISEAALTAGEAEPTSRVSSECCCGVPISIRYHYSYFGLFVEF